ncbi:MAG TPA: methyl-accepting chemotaxis protein [Nitrospirota bacterium]
MVTTVKQVTQEGMMNKLRDRIGASVGLKFLLGVTTVITVLMVMGTVFCSWMILKYQYSNTEDRGHELEGVLGRAVADRLAQNDYPGVNLLAQDVAKLPDVLYVVIAGANGVPLTSAQSSFNQTDQAVKDVFAEEKTGDVVKLISALRNKLAPIEVFSEIMLNGAKIGEVRMAFSRAQMKSNAWMVALLLFGTSVMISAALSSVVHAMVRRMVVTPTSAARDVVSNVASGDLTHEVPVRSTDEIGVLGRGVNRMITGLKGMIDNVREAAHKTDTIWAEVKGMSTEITGGSKVQAESVEEAASSVNEMHFALKEIGGSVEDLHKTSELTSSSVIEMAATVDEVARTMTDLSTSIEETSTSITQMSVAIRQIAENVEILSSAAEETAASAAEISASVREVETNAKESASLAEAVVADAQQLGMLSIEKTLEGMGRIESTARRTADAVNRLGERAESIGSILTVIEDITDQTGLLALNAAILAAQAGEHGKGFAVVAAEIRELANRTAASTQEIGKLITSVQEETRDAVAVMQEEVTMVGEGVRLAGNARDALRKILERADRSRDMSRSISKAAAEQTRGIRQVSEAIGKINEMTQQIARATNEQNTGSEQIKRASERMREFTHTVKATTDEQSKGGKDIAAAVERMAEKIGMVNRAAGEVQAGSDLIVRAIERVKDIAKSNADLSGGLNVAMDVMAKQSASLRKEIEKFRT